MFDLGGGTFDVSVLDIGKSVFDVVAVGGDTYLGGEDFDRRVVDWLTFRFAKEHDGVDLRSDKMALQRLQGRRREGEVRAVVGAASAARPPAVPRRRAARQVAALHLDAQLSREKLEELTRDLVDRCIAGRRERTLQDAGVRARADRRGDARRRA